MSRLGAWLMQVLTGFGPWSLGLVAFADSSFVPLPQAVDTLIITHAIVSPSTAYFGAAMAVVGSLIGSLVLFDLARRGGRRMLERKSTPGFLRKIERYIVAYGGLVLLVPTLVPIPLPMAPVVIATGIFQMGTFQFMAVIVFGRVVRYFGVAFLGLQYGNQTVALLRENTLASLGVGLVTAMVFYLGYRRITERLNRD